MTYENIGKTLKILALTISVAAFIGCGLTAKSSAKNENPGKQIEIKPEAVPKATIDTKLFGVNLIKNGDAETGNGNGWTNSDNLKTIIYGEFGGGPYPDSPGPKNRGEKYFYANIGSDKPSVIFAQKIETGGIIEAIDKGAINYDFGGWFGGVNGSYSSARLKISFLDAGGKELSTDETGEVKETDRADDLVLIERQKSGAVPNGTRKIEVKLEFYIRAGHDKEELATNAYADNLSLVLTPKGAN